MGVADELFELRLQAAATETAAGWGCFHAEQAWFARTLPSPLLNDLGRRYAVEQLKETFAPGAYKSEFLASFYAGDRQSRDGYRSHLFPGPLAVDGEPGAEIQPWDHVANDITLRLASEGQIHYRYEVTRDREDAWRDVLRRGGHTPPPLFSSRNVAVPVPTRTPGVPAEHDKSYWSAKYWRSEVRVNDPSGVDKPNWIIELMRIMAASYTHDPVRSTRNVLRFVRPVNNSWGWALQFERTPSWFEPRPRLVCLPLEGKAKVPTTGSIPWDSLLRVDAPLDMSPRGVELALAYWIPRVERFAERLESVVEGCLQ